jgi:hypothetical protein
MESEIMKNKIEFRPMGFVGEVKFSLHCSCGTANDSIGIDYGGKRGVMTEEQIKQLHGLIHKYYSGDNAVRVLNPLIFTIVEWRL